MIFSRFYVARVIRELICLFLAFLLLPKAFPGPQATEPKLIAMTFDDGPRPLVLLGARDTGHAGLLDMLDRSGVKATFFVVGWRAKRSVGSPLPVLPLHS